MKLILKLPDDSLLKAQIGDSIEIGKPFYAIRVRQEKQIDIPKQLGINPNDIFKYFNKVIGDSVKPGEILAEKKSFFGLKTIVSEYEGNIQKIDHTIGIVTISTNTDKFITRESFVNAELVSFNKQRMLVAVEVSDGIEFEISGPCEDGGGPTHYLKGSHDYFTVTDTDVNLISL